MTVPTTSSATPAKPTTSESTPTVGTSTQTIDTIEQTIGTMTITGEQLPIISTVFSMSTAGGTENHEEGQATEVEYVSTVAPTYDICACSQKRVDFVTENMYIFNYVHDIVYWSEMLV